MWPGLVLVTSGRRKRPCGGVGRRRQLHVEQEDRGAVESHQGAQACVRPSTDYPEGWLAKGGLYPFQNEGISGERGQEEEVYEEEVGDVHPEVAAARAAGRIGKGKVKTCFRCGSFNHKIKDCMVQSRSGE